ncbi:tyrosine-type recombinase/integrase [Sphingopyxis sp. P8]|uniref:tyrosine-type recombinase/integrase n=1 Tax=Sphingopyxis sp. P8 TaxID=2763256 RepID=UPI001D0B8EB1|nr:integrase family protein [Sphingopyxis sp. P8]
MASAAKKYPMEQRRLANADLSNLRVPKGALALEVRDTACDGLRLRVSPTGKMTWSVVYRVAGKGKVTNAGTPKKGPPTRVTLGTAKEVKYGDARKQALEIMELASQGVDYAEKRKEAASGHSSRTVEALVDRFIDEYARPVTAKSGNREELARNWLTKPELEKWHGRELSEITRADIHAVLDKVVSGRGEPAAIEMRKHLSKFFHWAVDRQLITTNPISRLDRVEAYTERERVLSMDELRQVWDAAGEMGNPFGPMYRMLILTGARRAEIGEMERSERRDVKLDKDDEETVPAVVLVPSRVKNRRGRTFYLSPPAVEVLDSVPVFKDKFVFSSTGGKTPVSGYSKAQDRIMRIISEKANEAAVERGDEPPEPMEHWTMHDIRRSVATCMAEMGIPGEHIEEVLGHSREKLRRTYNKHTYASEVREAMLRWGALWA